MCYTYCYWCPELVYNFLSGLDNKWLSYEPKTLCLYLGIPTKFDRFQPINWSIINIFNETNTYTQTLWEKCKSLLSEDSLTKSRVEICMQVQETLTVSIVPKIWVLGMLR